MVTHIGSKIHVGITNSLRLQFKILINIVDHGNSIMMNKEDVVSIKKDVGVVSIAVNVNFGLDPHVRVGWTRFVPHVFHIVR